MHRFYTLVLLLTLVSVTSYGQRDSVVYYTGGYPKYIQTYDNDTLVQNTLLSVDGDTIYQWNVRTGILKEHSYIGEFLQRREYDSVRKQKMITQGMQPIEHAQLFQTIMPRLEPTEWRNMHDRFYYLCNNYTRLLFEGDFTIYIAYKGHIPSGVFEKYYRDRLVVKGQYKDGRKTGFWHYYPYYFYPYYDITFHDWLGREWSILYSCIPAFLCIALLITLYWRLEQKDRYRSFFFGVVVAAFIALALRLFIRFNLWNVWIHYTIPAVWFTLWHSMMIFIIINIFRGKRIKIPVVINILLLLVGLVFSVYVLFFKYLGF